MIMAAALMVALTPATTETDFESRPHYSKQEIRRAITFYAKRYRLDPALLRAVIKAESDFRQDVVSHKGAIGLMQLTPDTAATLRVADVHDSIQNIRGGAKQIRRLLRLYEGDLPLALAAYNAGVHRVKGHKVPRIRETRRYVRKVLSHYHRSQAKQSTTRATNPGVHTFGRSASFSKAWPGGFGNWKSDEEGLRRLNP
jgi:soluble lytic murein transglycosylase-like protein